MAQPILVRLQYTMIDEHNPSRTYRYTFGAWHINEGFSSLVQQQHGQAAQTASDGYEYLLVDRILDVMFDSPTLLAKVAICHWALQSEHPAVVFIDLISHLRSRYLMSLPCYAQVYDDCRQWS